MGSVQSGAVWRLQPRPDGDRNGGWSSVLKSRDETHSMPAPGETDRRRRGGPARPGLGLTLPNPTAGLLPRAPVWYAGARKEPRMATAEEFRRLALALEGTTEAPHVDRTAFRVARIFATLAPDDATGNLKLEPDEQELKCLLQPAAFAPVPNRWSAQGWTTIRLDAIALPELQGALELAWRHAQPRGRSKKQGSALSR